MNYLGIKASELNSVAKELNKLLASYNIYYQNLRSFHWHIHGNSFFDLHHLFEQYYNQAKSNIDEIAERILTIGHKPDGSLKTYLQNSSIDEAEDLLQDAEMVNCILQNQTILISSMRDIIKTASSKEDEGTIDLIGGMLSKIENEAWLLFSWQKKVQSGFLQNLN